MVDISGLSFSYGDHNVLRNISFHAGEGQLVAVLGPNGAGKSTMFRCILGFLPGYTGNISLNGCDIRTLDRLAMARLVAYIPQSSDPVFDYTVEDIVLMGTTSSLEPLRSPGQLQLERAESTMDRLGLLPLRHRGIGQISGGERQLALIARAMAQQAKILIMDEPTANLDYGNQYLVLQTVRMLAESGYTVMMSTHNPDHALHYSTNILALGKDGACRSGLTADILTAELVEKIYGLPVMITETETSLGLIRNCIPRI